MVLPAQAPANPQFDAELSYWLKESAPQVKWVLPEDLDRALARNPALGIQARALEVSVFRRAQVKRIGDPLFGDLRRLAALFDTRLALLPVYSRGAEVAVALIDTHFGDVAWFGIVAGADSTAASTAQRLATMLAPPKQQH